MGESFSAPPVFKLISGKSEVLYQAGASNTLSFVISWFMSSMPKPSALTLLRLFIHNTVHCCVHGNAKLSLKVSYAVSASVLDL